METISALHWRKRRDLVLAFDELTDREKLIKLAQTLLDIGDLGVKAPVNRLHSEPSVTVNDL